jgi:endonuclease/exonuclease/phosphatase family metal-dependent hydrolase
MLLSTYNIHYGVGAAGNSEEEVDSFPREGRIDHVLSTATLRLW